jgi:hypothetical protein
MSTTVDLDRWIAPLLSVANFRAPDKGTHSVPLGPRCFPESANSGSIVNRVKAWKQLSIDFCSRSARE